MRNCIWHVQYLKILSDIQGEKSLGQLDVSLEFKSELSAGDINLGVTSVSVGPDEVRSPREQGLGLRGQ